jgi:putative transposase
MRQAGLHGRAAKRWKRTTIADPRAAARADRVRRDFTADAAAVNSRWCGDITYISTWEGWLYLSVTWNQGPRVGAVGVVGHGSVSAS